MFTFSPLPFTRPNDRTFSFQDLLPYTARKQSLCSSRGNVVVNSVTIANRAKPLLLEIPKIRFFS